MYDMRLATVCEFLQANDHNGEFDILFQEVLNGETPKSVAYEACRNAITNVINYELSPEDTKELGIWRSWLDYVNQ